MNFIRENGTVSFDALLSHCYFVALDYRSYRLPEPNLVNQLFLLRRLIHRKISQLIRQPRRHHRDWPRRTLAHQKRRSYFIYRPRQINVQVEFFTVDGLPPDRRLYILLFY